MVVYVRPVNRHAGACVPGTGADVWRGWRSDWHDVINSGVLEAGAVGDADEVSADRVDFFISHAGADRAWAQWVADQLTDAGHSVELDVRDWTAGQPAIWASLAGTICW
jgi:hypothetical protein